MDYNPFFTGLALSREAHSFVMFIFGVTGDLTRKKLMPAMFSLFSKGYIGQFKIVGFARRPWTTESFREEAQSMIDIPEFASVEPGVKDAFLRNLDYISSTFEDPSGYKAIDGHCEGYKNRLYYLSTPPANYPAIIENLGSLRRESRSPANIIVEKPFGRDLASARELNELLSRNFDEKEIFRIDHYLGKETVQNIMLLRFGNGIFEPIWNNRYIHNIQITVAEKIGVGTRGNYYESSGALRDMVQNHLFQLLCLTTMEPPNDLNPDTIRTEKVKILKSLRPITFKDAAERTVRGQYAAGYVDGEATLAYRQENGVSPESRIESFVAMKLYLDTWRWAAECPSWCGRGKRLSRRVSEISVQFKEPPLALFPKNDLFSGRNTLVIRIQPDEGITLNMNAKIPGYSTEMRPVKMDFFLRFRLRRDAPRSLRAAHTRRARGRFDPVHEEGRDRNLLGLHHPHPERLGGRPLAAAPVRSGKLGTGRDETALTERNDQMEKVMKTVFDPVKIEKDLRILERERSLTETRTSLFNLVIIGRKEDEQEVEEDLLAYLLGKRAARVIHINLDRPGQTQVSVSARCAPDKENKGVCFQEILIEDGEDRAGTSPGSWSAFLVRDIPVIVLWRGSLNRKDVLTFTREQADKFLVDGDLLVSRLGMTVPEYLGRVKAELTDQGILVADFAWRRFQPLRVFTALVFEAEGARALLPGLRGLEISGGGRASQELYVRWMAEVLDWKKTGPSYLTPQGEILAPRHGKEGGKELRLSFDLKAASLELVIDANRYGTARLGGKEIFSKVLAFPQEGELLLQEVDMPGIDGLYARVVEKA